MNDKRIFVIIVTYNGLRWTDRCLSSLRASSYPVKGVVVDNNSSDETVSYTKAHYPEVHVIANSYNAGFGKANNSGINYALDEGADFVFLLNQDAWLEPPTIGAMVHAGLRSPEFAVLSPLHFTGSGTSLDRGFEYNCTRQYDSPVVQQWIKDTSHTICPVAFINAAAWLISRNGLETIGGFGPLFFHYGEDRDFTQRLAYFNLSLGVVTGTKISHDREDRDVDALRNSLPKLFNYYYIGSLVRLSDLRQPLFAGYWSIIWWNVKEGTFLLFRGKWRAPAVLFGVVVSVTAKIGVVAVYRKKIRSGKKFLFIGNP